MKELENEQEIRKLHVTIVYKGFHTICSFGEKRRTTARRAVELIRRQAEAFSRQATDETLCVLLRYEVPMWDFNALAGDPPKEWLEEENAFSSLLEAADGLAKDQNVIEE